MGVAGLTPPETGGSNTASETSEQKIYRNKMAATKLLICLLILSCLSGLISSEGTDSPYRDTFLCRMFLNVVKMLFCSVPGGAGSWYCPLVVNAFLNRCSDP